MTVTVRKMIANGGYDDFVVLAGGAGLDARIVRTVCVVDTPDVSGWIYGGEFLLSCGYIFRDDPIALLHVIEDASKAGAAALGIKVGRFIGSVPESAIRMADACAFPLIDIPAHYNHNDIINPVLRDLINTQARRLDFSETVRNGFFEIMMNDGSVEQILERLRSFIDRDVVFVDLYGGGRVAVGSEAFRERVLSLSREKLFESYRREGLRIGDRTHGYLFLGPSEREDDDIDIPMTHAKTTLLLRLQRDIVRQETERRFIEQFVQDLLRRNLRTPREIWDKARIYKWRLDGPQVALFFRNVSTIPELVEREYQLCVSMLRTRFGPFPHAEMNGGLVAVLPVDGGFGALRAYLCESLEWILDSVGHQTAVELRVGVGAQRESIQAIDKSFREAQRALDLTQRAGDAARIVFWDDLGVYKILSLVQASDDAKDFVESHLGPLIEYDERKGEGLVPTLVEIVRHNWQLKAASSSLNVHYNTVKYRFRKICQLLGEEELSPGRRFELALAVELLEIRRRGEQG